MNAVVQFQAPRLPYHPVIEERFGVDKTAWKALVEAVFPSAKTPDAVIMALAYCKARNLDPFKRPVHIVPVYDSTRRQMVETVWPGISELRTTAMRTGLYGGCDEVAYGPEITRTFEWHDDKRGAQRATVTFPEWAMLTIYRLVAGTRVPVPGPKTYWLESCATRGKTDVPNDMWLKRPRGQIEKCAEAAALRRAFPEEIGGEFAAEEMEGKTIGGAAIPGVADAPTLNAPRQLHAGFDDPAPTAQGEPPAETSEPIDAEFEETAAQADHGDQAVEAPDTPETAAGDADEAVQMPPMKTGAQLLAEKQAAEQRPKASLAERVSQFKAECEGKSTGQLARVWTASSSLRNDLEAADPDTTPATPKELEDWWQAVYDAAEAREREAAQGGAR